MNPKKTYEITLSFPKTSLGSACKEAVMDWLKEKRIDTYVEGVIDGLDVDHEYGLPDENFYEDHGGEFSPIILCSFDQDYILALQNELKVLFLETLVVTYLEMDTETWQHGWKDSFPAIVTDLFRILPSWETDLQTDDKICIYIEPGMAFGTGQHASTQVCLLAMEQLKRRGFDFTASSVLDVGTGSGILAIAAMKLGSQKVSASDIDKDALLAALQNGKSNHVQFPIFEGSLPPHQSFDLVIANILYTVLAPMLPQLASALAENGTLLLSGLIEEQEADMVRLAEQAGLKFMGKESLQAWVALTFVLSDS